VVFRSAVVVGDVDAGAPPPTGTWLTDRDLYR